MTTEAYSDEDGSLGELHIPTWLDLDAQRALDVHQVVALIYTLEGARHVARGNDANARQLLRLAANHLDDNGQDKAGPDAD